MKRIVLIILLTAFFIGSGAWAAEVRYKVTVLGTLGGDGSFAYDINDLGQVVGDSRISGVGVHAFLYSGGAMRDLGTLGGPTSRAYAINNLSQVVGESTPAQGRSHAFLYVGGTMKDLGTLGGESSAAFGINNFGKVVGRAETADGDYRAFLFFRGKMKDLGTFGGYSFARDINDAGRVTGDAFLLEETPDDGPKHAFLYSHGNLQDLGSIGGTSEGWAVNDRGQVAGMTWNLVGNFDHAMVYRHGTMQDLGTLGGLFSYARDIDNRGRIVGFSEIADGQFHAFIHADGIMRDLNDLLVKDTFEGIIRFAEAINCRGQIAATAEIGGQLRAVLLTPVRVKSGPGP